MSPIYTSGGVAIILEDDKTSVEQSEITVKIKVSWNEHLLGIVPIKFIEYGYSNNDTLFDTT